MNQQLYFSLQHKKEDLTLAKEENIFLSSDPDNVTALVWLSSAVCLALGWDLGMVDGTKETLYQSYWIGYTEIFLGKESWRLDCFVFSLIVLNLMKQLMLLLGKCLLSGRWTLARKEHKGSWTKGLSEVGEVHIPLEESISLMAQSVFKAYWLLMAFLSDAVLSIPPLLCH